MRTAVASVSAATKKPKMINVKCDSRNRMVEMTLMATQGHVTVSYHFLREVTMFKTCAVPLTGCHHLFSVHDFL